MRGQLSVEFLVITSVLLVVLGTVVYVVTTEYQSARQNIDSILARKALKELMSAASDVHSQGDGARRVVRVGVPNNVEGAYVASNHLRYRMSLAGRTQDIIEPSDFCLTGYLPQDEGGQWVTVESIGTCVRIGDETFRALPTRLDFRLYPGESQSKRMNMTNFGSESLDYSITLSGTSLISISPENGTVSPASQEEVIVYASSLESTSPGYYASELTVDAAGYLSKAYISVLIVSERNLTLYPGQNDVAAYAGGNSSDDYMACNSGDTLLSDIHFSCSGTVCGWVSYPEGAAIAELEPGRCQQVKLLVSVPPQTASGTYSGIFAAQSGDGTNDFSSLNVTVIGSAATSTTSSTLVSTSSTSTTSTTLQSCGGFCQAGGYAQGTCRQNPQQCANNGETHQPAGDIYCMAGSQEDTCCCE